MNSRSGGVLLRPGLPPGRFFAWPANSRSAASWFRTNLVNTNGAAAKVMTFWLIGEEGTPWLLWEYKSRLTGVPKQPLCQKHEIRSDPISADPICLFPTYFRGLPSVRGDPACHLLPYTYTYIDTYIYIYIYTHNSTNIYIYIYIYLIYVDI